MVLPIRFVACFAGSSLKISVAVSDGIERSCMTAETAACRAACTAGPAPWVATGALSRNRSSCSSASFTWMNCSATSSLTSSMLMDCCWVPRARALNIGRRWWNR